METGDTLRDIVTGFKGIAIAKIEHIDGKVEYRIQPKISSSGAMVGFKDIVDYRLEVTERRTYNYVPK